MALMRNLNRELGTTLIVVTHDSTVAYQTERILMMRDGRIVREQMVGASFEEDLEAFRRSGLGQAILAGNTMRLNANACAVLREVLERAGG